MRGGPFYRLQQYSHLLDEDQWNIGRRIIFVIAVGWLPLLIMKLLFDRGNLVPFLRDYGVNARMFLAIPVLIIGQPLMEAHFRLIVDHVYKVRLLDETGLAKVKRIISEMMRLGDSVFPEIIILLLIAIRTSTAYQSLVVDSPWMIYRTGNDFHLNMAGWYTVLVTATIFQFLLGLNLWKWLLWTIFAFRFSRLNLRVVATHPDENGGLSFLGMTPLAFAPIAFATTLVIGATFRREILHHSAHLKDFMLPGIVLVAIFAILALGPLVFFVPRLAKVRRRGILDYAVLGQLQSTDFHDKWVVHRADHEAEFMGAPEISTLCDYGSAYQNVENMKPFPTDRGALAGLAIAILIAALPTVIAQIPLVVILKQLLGALR
jgi:hypothetical protein